MTQYPTAEMIEAGARAFRQAHQYTCYPDAADWECVDAAKRIYAAMRAKEQSHSTPSPALPASELEELVERNEKRFWIVVHEPGLIPRIKGPYLDTGTKEMLRDFIRHYPTAYIDVLKINDRLAPEITHGPELLQMLDGRSMSVGRKHNERTRAAHDEHHVAQAAPETGWQGMRVKPCALCGEVEELANCATECPERQGVWQKMGEALEELEPLCHSETRQRLLAIIHRGLGRTDDLPPEAELYRQYLAEAPDVAFHTWATTRADLGKAKP